MTALTLPQSNFDILVVDDTPASLRVMANVLADAGFRVRTALDGEMALRSVAHAPPALVLLDVRMPDMDGFEVCRRIKAAAASVNVPVIMLSAQDDSASRVEGFAAGAIDFIGKPFMVEDVLARIGVHLALWQSQNELRKNLARQIDLNKTLADLQNQLLQSEKMASLGQLAAGVAHELNNPIGFVHSNLGTLEKYLEDIFEIASVCEGIAGAAASPDELVRLKELKSAKDFDYLRTDIFALMHESKDGLSRVRKIVQDLKDFSRAGELEWQTADIHAGIDSTLNIVANELKYKVTVTKNYAPDLPLVHCLPAQLNQVFMNLLVNAAQATELEGGRLGQIIITTRKCGDNEIQIIFQDHGKGISPENLRHIFDPFFTTKLVGQGTGLGLSIVWGIVGKHHGNIRVDSTPGQGATFTITLPVKPAESHEPQSS